MFISRSFNKSSICSTSVLINPIFAKGIILCELIGCLTKQDLQILQLQLAQKNSYCLEWLLQVKLNKFGNWTFFKLLWVLLSFLKKGWFK